MIDREKRRRIAKRYEKLAATFLGFVYLGAIIDWISFEVQRTRSNYPDDRERVIIRDESMKRFGVGKEPLQ